MKKLVQVQEIEGEGLAALMGERITVYCPRYFYTGKLVGINETCLMLEDAGIVYSVGKHSEKNWAEYEALPGVWYVHLAAIESFGVFKVTLK